MIPRPTRYALLGHLHPARLFIDAHANRLVICGDVSRPCCSTTSQSRFKVTFGTVTNALPPETHLLTNARCEPSVVSLGSLLLDDAEVAVKLMGSNVQTVLIVTNKVVSDEATLPASVQVRAIPVQSSV